SCVNNLRLQGGRKIVHDHSIYVVDLQDGGNWDWSKGEPPKDNPAYYLRFCKSFSRMGGIMRYVQSDNVAFLHNLLKRLERRWKFGKKLWMRTQRNNPSTINYPLSARSLLDRIDLAFGRVNGTS